jgi:hypothetical protein
MAMNRSMISKQLQVGLNSVWGLEYNQLPEEWRRIFEVNTSKKAFEEDVLMTGFGSALVKPEGAEVSFDSAAEGWTSRYTHDTYALAFSITEECLEDNQYMQMGAKYTKALARAMISAKEIRAASILNFGFDVTHAGGDAVALLSASHPVAAGGVQSNILATPADISEAAIEDLLTQVRLAKDDRGLPIALKAVDLIIPPNLIFTASRLLESTLRPGTPDNDINVINKKRFFGKEPADITRLTDTDAWFIKTDVQDGLKYFDRVQAKFSVEDDFKTGNFRSKVRSRFVYGWTNWRSLYGSAGA